MYYMLGNYYAERNVNQAWLCYENAEFYCDNVGDAELIHECRKQLEGMSKIEVRPVSIIILTYNNRGLNEQCITSVRHTLPKGAYEIVVVDNGSTDGTVEWLKEQDDITRIYNKENKGFPVGCNQGIKAAESENDILLLNNDVIVLPNAVFWLRMGLYEPDHVGAVGCITNSAVNNQKVKFVDNKNIHAMVVYGQRANVPRKDAYEDKAWLQGFAMMIKREALDEIGLLDTRFSPGCSEDVDYGIRLNFAGWKVRLCYNSFLIHYGNGNGLNKDVWESNAEIASKKLEEKWGFVISYSASIRQECIDFIKHGKKEPIRVLEVGCGCGATLSHIKYLWQNAIVKGIEIDPLTAKLGANYVDIIQGNIEEMSLPYEKAYFDYILCLDVLEHLRYPEETVRKLKPYLKKDGRMVCSIPNIMNMNVVAKLLQGEFEYADAGILDRTHLRFFTLKSIQDMMERCGMRVHNINFSFDKKNEKKIEKKDREIIDALLQLPHIAEKLQFMAVQYLFDASCK